jgi:hypothetical protein
MAPLKIAQSVFVFFAITFTLSFTNAAQENAQIFDLFNQLKTNSSKPDYEVFEKAMKGYTMLKENKKIGDKNILTIIDFSISSNKKRMWVIDLGQLVVLKNTLVSHGKNTGQEFAREFSNTPGSRMSSLGFYVTGKTYFGKHGLSLYLDGMEEGFNNNARKRAIVMHGAGYINKAFSKEYGRLGRSFGCPAIPMDKHKDIIKLLANRTCLFIYFPDDQYLNSSKLINYDK